MTSHALSPAFRARPGRRPDRRSPRIRRILRVAAGLSLLAAAGAVLASSQALTSGEVALLSSILDATFAEKAIAGTSHGVPAVFFGGPAGWFGLKVTALCAIAYYIGPLLALGGILLAGTRIGVLRVLAATAVGSASLILLNQLRLFLIAFAYRQGDHGAFNWMHGPVGSTIMLIGVAGVFVAFFTICLRGRRATV
jgi:exosortase/archaeosortase family protein